MMNALKLRPIQSIQFGNFILFYSQKKFNFFEVVCLYEENGLCQEKNIMGNRYFLDGST
jgi:hypothetical protein